MPLNVRWSVQLVYGSMYVCMYVCCKATNYIRDSVYGLVCIEVEKCQIVPNDVNCGSMQNVAQHSMDADRER